MGDASGAAARRVPRRTALLGGAFVGTAAFVLACGGVEKTATEAVAPPTQGAFLPRWTPTLSADGARRVHSLGTMRVFAQLGAYAVLGDDGFLYELPQLDDAFKQEGLRVEFMGVINESATSKIPDGRVLVVELLRVRA
ncbi:MAG: hypothetical protein FJ029_13890 [Actinobacteria bacterium]|nr:hypothetical protein [Actinomycetota bacterium]